MHRDLKPSNLLVNQVCDIKICDFGMARGFGASEKGPDFQMDMTHYVTTRWYRAPEAVLSTENYTENIDIWSIGCIFSELMCRQVLFPGNHHLKMLDKIIEIIGSLQDDDFDFISNPVTLNYLKKLPRDIPPVDWAKKIPHATPMAIDLLSKMLVFNP